MLGSNLEEVDPACIIKIDAFIDSLKQQFEPERDQWTINCNQIL